MIILHSWIGEINFADIIKSQRLLIKIMSVSSANSDANIEAALKELLEKVPIII